ncbi:putative disease resistance protein RGA3 [Dichanthelium oligosanthes]|uniref:Putative disease resistance protein RGA3 n=1 Tax=Dichanthelium oligosanthes TaxID=888268 RepID=A0A1E5VSC0_9POAL|nr:putative disease resistance protein RGA3 [Dichanthelium oligosanthes]
MGDAVLSAFLQVLFQVIADLVQKELQSQSGLQNERKSLISNVEMIQAVLRRAEKMQLSELQKNGSFSYDHVINLLLWTVLNPIKQLTVVLLLSSDYGSAIVDLDIFQVSYYLLSFRVALSSLQCYPIYEVPMNSILSMGDVVLSAFLQVLFQVIADLVQKELQSQSGLQNERKSLISNVEMIQAVLRGAEKMQLSELQKSWFSELKDVSYDAADVLDEHIYEIRRHQVISLAGVRNSPIMSHLSLRRQIFTSDMRKKIKGIANRIACMKDKRLTFQVDVHGHTGQDHESRILQQSSNFAPTFVYGRHNDQEKIVEMLLQSDLKPNVAVLPIVGEAYMGKTTVAQLVFNDERVSSYFELKLWVHVSHEFDIARITASMIESIEGKPFSGNLSTLQTHLAEQLKDTRYLLVLDDYWRESWYDWHGKLELPLLKGAVGSKIIVTTRSVEVARVLGTSTPYRLQRLQDEDCWWLFCHFSQGTETHTYNFQDIPR